MISIVIPTYNEVDNIARIVPRIYEACDGASIDVQIVVADDLSPDGTADKAEEVIGDRKGKVLRRQGPRGLAPAVVDGFAAADGEILGVMDADMSHPPETLPRMVEAIVEGGADLAIGSRYVKGGGMEGWPWKRRFVSRVACLMARPVTWVRDATSGYFLCKRQVVDGLALNPKGFKIGLEVFVRGRWKTRKEVPFVFTDRAYGASKLGSKVMTEYITQLVRLFLWRLVHPFGAR